MSVAQQYITTASGKRLFHCCPVAVQAVIVNSKEEILFLSSPTRNRDGSWQVVSGALEAQESILEGTLRETYEELGTDINVRPLGTIHVQTFQYDEKVNFMVAVYYLLAYEGGKIVPGDDMVGSRFRWCSLSEVIDENFILHIPPDHKWMMRRAIELYQLWHEKQEELQPKLDQ